jgi:hypothetical protein
MSMASEVAVEEGDTSSDVRMGDIYGTQALSEAQQAVDADRKEVDEEIGLMITRYFSLFLLVTYLVLPSVTTRIAGVIPTVNIDPDGVTGLHQHYMRNDLSIATNSQRYRFGIIWAAIFLVVYPIGVPLLYLYVLWYNRKAIKSTVDDIPKRDTSSPQPHERFSMHLLNGIGSSIRLGMSKGLGAEKIKASTETAAISAAKDASDPKKQQRGSRFKSFLVSSDKNIMDYITPESIYFLHGAYESQFFYWEVLETLRRILLAAVVSVISPGR